MLYKSNIEDIAELYLGGFNSKILEEPILTPIEQFLESYLHLGKETLKIILLKEVLNM